MLRPPTPSPFPLTVPFPQLSQRGGEERGCNGCGLVVVVMDGYVRRFEVVDELIGERGLVNNNTHDVYGQANTFHSLLTIEGSTTRG